MKKRGFTLVEVLVVTSIIGMLASVVLVGVNNTRDKAHVAKFVQEIDSLRKAIQIYKTNNNDQLPPCPHPVLDPLIGPLSCLDLFGQNYFANALKPLVDEGYISKIPHFPNWPASSEFTGTSPYTYLYYRPSIYNSGPQANGVVEIVCEPVSIPSWKPGHTKGSILVSSSYQIPFKDGFTHCEYGSATNFCDQYYPRIEGNGRVYCIPLDF